MLTLVLALIAAAPCASGAPLRVHFYDVGQGLSALVNLPDGRNILIDTGSTQPKAYHDKLKRDLGGNDAVRGVKKTGERLASIVSEKRRLAEIYGQRDEQAKTLETLFPGLRPQFPLTISEVEELAAADAPEDYGSDILN